MKTPFSIFILCGAIAGCGGSGDSPPGDTQDISNSSFPASVSGEMTIVSLSAELFSNLPALLTTGEDIPVTATEVDGNVKITAVGVTPEDFQTVAILSKHPNGTSRGEICMYRNLDIIAATGTGEVNLSVTGVIEGDYVIRECNVKLEIASTNTEWDAITTQTFGPSEAAEVFFDKVLISRHIAEDTSLLYVGSFAADIVNNFATAPYKWPVLVNISKGIVCMNINPFPTLEGYISYFTPKVVVETNPPAGYTTAGLVDVNRPVAFAPNCAFDPAVWQGIWDNTP